MLDVKVSINGIILYCDESLIGVNLGRGYSIVKSYLDDLSFKDKITDGRGQLTISYFSSALSDSQGKYFICLKKDDVYQVGPRIKGPGVYTADNMMCEAEAADYNQAETQHLHKMFSLLRVFKEGNVGPKQIFLDHSYSLGILKSNIRHTSDTVTRNIVDERFFTLTNSELADCNQFLLDYSGAEYTLMKNCINEFVGGLAQVDVATGFEQYTTVLEMILLGHNQQGKKEVLSKRVAVLLESSSTDIKHMYDKMKDFYRYRSESLHEGDGQNITEIELIAMEDIVRLVLKKCLARCKTELAANPSVPWENVKQALIDNLKLKVDAENSAGTFVI